MVTSEELLQERLGRMAVRPRPPVADPPSQHAVPLGPPPSDAESARAAIVHAVEHLTEIDENDGCPNVQGGDNLAEAVRQASEPFGGTGSATFTCEDVHFIRADEAIIRFTVHVAQLPSGMALDGRAHLVDGRWVVDRVTVCRMLGMAGVRCPPPAG